MLFKHTDQRGKGRYLMNRSLIDTRQISIKLVIIGLKKYRVIDRSCGTVDILTLFKITDLSLKFVNHSRVKLNAKET